MSKMRSYANWRHHCTYEVSCHDREVEVLWNDDVDEDRVYELLDRKYDEWMHVDECPEAEYWCCEEWMLDELVDILNDWSVIYIDEMTPDAVLNYVGE